MQRANRILGIEGGGTKTEWVLMARGPAGLEIINKGLLPASNLKLIRDGELSALFEVLPHDASHVGAFLAGCGTEEDRRRLSNLAARRWPAALIRAGSDRESAMATAFGNEGGIAVIAGTGAAVHGRKGGRIEKAGGWGQLLGDLGGGYHIAMRGLRVVLSHFDLNQKITPLAEEILQTLGLGRLQDLVEWAMQADKMSVARLAPCIFHAARNNEPEMLNVVQNGATILAEFTRAVAQRLEFADVPVQLIGGLFVHHPDYVSLFKYRLSILLPKASVELCEKSGAIGAAWLAEGNDADSRMRNGADEKMACSIENANRGELPEDAPDLAAASTEQSNPRSLHLEKLSTSELVNLFVTEERFVDQALAAVSEPIGRGVDLVSAALKGGGRLFYIGAGTSGRLGVLDASEIPPTFGMPPDRVQGIIAGGLAALHRAVEGAEDQPEAGALAIIERGVRTGDVACGIAASGRTPYVLGALAKARELGAGTMLVTCNPARQRAAEPWDVEIDLATGPEIITGSTRLKAGTATKLVLNILSTCAMIRLGKVRGNSMIDLNVSNLKLRDRGVRIVSRELAIPYEQARTRLEKADWNVRACFEKS